MRFALGLAAIVATACAYHATPRPAYPTLCPTVVPKDAVSRDSIAIESLAARYILILVNTRGEFGDSVTEGMVDLWVNDSLRRYGSITGGLGRFPGERPLSGAFYRTFPPLQGVSDERASRDPARPGVELIGGTLYMGGIDMMDGGGERLVITRVSPEGFWGTWHWDGGIATAIDSVTKRRLAEPGGHFCAWRRAAPLPRRF